MPFRNAAFFLLGRGCVPAAFGRLAGGLDALDLPEERLAGALRGDELNAGEWMLEDWLARLRAEESFKTEADVSEAVPLRPSVAALRLTCTPAVFLVAVCRRPRHLRFIPQSERTPELCL